MIGTLWDETPLPNLTGHINVFPKTHLCWFPASIWRCYVLFSPFIFVPSKRNSKVSYNIKKIDIKVPFISIFARDLFSRIWSPDEIHKIKYHAKWSIFVSILFRITLGTFKKQVKLSPTCTAKVSRCKA